MSHTYICSVINYVVFEFKIIQSFKYILSILYIRLRSLHVLIMFRYRLIVFK